jgi:hypothetical protein
MDREYRGKLADPAWRVQRARKASLARTTADAHIDALIESKDPPTPEQAERLRAWLPAPAGGGDGS